MLAERAEQIVERWPEEGTGDFVTDVACELPLQAIAELLGVPQEDRHKIFAWSNEMIGYDDPEFQDEGTMARWSYSATHGDGRGRAASPRDDIVTQAGQRRDRR